MAAYKAEGIVIRTRSLGEADLVVVVYTLDGGKVAAAARGAKRSTSRLLGPTQLFAHGRYLFYHGRNLHRLSQGEVCRSFRRLRGDLVPMAYASYLAELTDVATEVGEPHESVFQALLGAFGALEAGTDGALSARWFELQLMRELGYGPILDRCGRCGSPFSGEGQASGRFGGVLCRDCRDADPDGVPFTAGALATLRALASSPPSRLHVLRPSTYERRCFETFLRRHIDFHIGRRVKSLDFLRQVESIG